MKGTPSMLGHSHLPLIVLICLLLSVGPAFAATVPMQEIAPAASTEVLTNPGMGVYLLNGYLPEDMPADGWYTPIVSIGYFRDDWSVLCPEAEGRYRFAEYFEPIFDLWVKRLGKRVAFRFMSQNMFSAQRYVTPKWVFDAGVPAIVHQGHLLEQVDPVFWDETYLAIQERFIADLGRYLDGRPGLEYLDIGGIGQWGEMHLNGWTNEELAATGYTQEKYVAAYRRIIDAYARAFPRTRVFLNIGIFGAINDYAATRGMHFRYDGLGRGPIFGDMDIRYFQPYSRRRVMSNFEIAYGFDPATIGQDVRATFEKGLESPISYLHANIYFGEGRFTELLPAPEEVRTAVIDAARRLGYRFLLTRLRCNETVNLDGVLPGRVVLEQTWKNTGVAPCYDSYALRWSLLNAQGETVASSVTYPTTPTTLWWPGEEISLRSNLEPVPANTPPGSYRLKVEMLQPEQPGRPEQLIQLGITGRDAQGRYDLGEVRVEHTSRISTVVYHADFASDDGGWAPSAGMTATRDPVGGKDGRAALALSGTQVGNAWSYAGVKQRLPMRPYTRYRLSCWMRVDRVDPTQTPYLLLGVYDADGNFLANFESDCYNVSHLGTWQRLVADVGWSGNLDTDALAATGELVIAKGPWEQVVSADIRISDVRLELVASP